MAGGKLKIAQVNELGNKPNDIDIYCGGECLVSIPSRFAFEMWNLATVAYMMNIIVRDANGMAVLWSEIGFPITRRKINKVWRFVEVTALTQDPQKVFALSPGCCFVREPDSHSDRAKPMNTWQICRKPACRATRFQKAATGKNDKQKLARIIIKWHAALHGLNAAALQNNKRSHRKRQLPVEPVAVGGFRICIAMLFQMFTINKSNHQWSGSGSSINISPPHVRQRLRGKLKQRYDMTQNLKFPIPTPPGPTPGPLPRQMTGANARAEFPSIWKHAFSENIWLVIWEKQRPPNHPWTPIWLQLSFF